VLGFCEEKKKLYESYFEHPLQELPAIALLDQAAGCVLLEMNDLAGAERMLVNGLRVGQWMPREELPGYLALARLYVVQGDEQKMSETLRRLDMRWPDILYCTRAMRLLYALKLHPDHPETRRAAMKWVDENPPEIGPEIVLPGIGPAWNDEGDYAVYCAWVQMQILFSRTVDALAALQPLLDCAIAHGLNHRVIELSLLQAQAFYHQGQKERCWKPLRAALSLAESESYLRLLDQGPVLARLFNEAATLGIAPQTIRRNIEAVQGGQTPASPPAGQAESLSAGVPTAATDGLLEPLSSREIEVLRLMSAGLSNTEIAARLYLSPNTLKAHAQNIFSKLDVHSRVQAINKARELKLI
jgi:ATP/maltotriose-dependent transcriptional regulator MalT